MTHDEVTAAMKAEDVDPALVEAACRARWDAQGSTFTGYNGDVARTWDALTALFPTEAENHRAVERHALAAVLPHFAAVVAANTLEDAAENLDLPGSTAVGYYASEQHAGYGDAERDVERWLTYRAARIRAEDAARLTTTTEEPK